METKHNEIDQVRDIGGYVIDCYAEYGNYTNLSRHVPRLEDGLKPVYKRVILAALDAPKDKRIKTATLIGSTIGCFTGDTELLDVNNSRLKLKDLSERDLIKSPVYTLSYSLTGEPRVARVIGVWSRGDRNNLVRVTLDNNESFVCTADHNILTWNGYEEAAKLESGTSLIPVTIESVDSTNTKVGQRRIVCFNGKSKLVYKLSSEHKDCEDVSDKTSKMNVHHKDCDALNDYPNNLIRMNESEHRALHGRMALTKFNTQGGLSQRNKQKWQDPRYQEYMKNCVSKGNKNFYHQQLLELLSSSEAPHSSDSLYKASRRLNLRVGYGVINRAFELLTPEEVTLYNLTPEGFFSDTIDMSMCKGSSDADHMWYRQTFRVLRNISRDAHVQVTEELYDSYKLEHACSFWKSVSQYRNLYEYFNLVPCEVYWKSLRSAAESSREKQLLTHIFQTILNCKSNGGYDTLEKTYNEHRSKRMPKWNFYVERYPELLTEEFYSKVDTLVPMNHKVVSVEPLSISEEVFDVTVDSPEHNFALAAGCVAKNCYHPHGDASVNDVVAQLVRAGVLVGKGNFGDKGMFKWTDFGAAAPRYTEVMVDPEFRAAVSKLLPYVPTHLNDLDNWEADYVPVSFPLSLSMGSFGIGVGLNVNIPAFDSKSMVKAGYAALCNKPEPWKLLTPNYGLTMSDEDKESFWKNCKGTLTYNFTVEPASSGNLNGWYIKGDPSYVKPNFSKLFKLKDDWGKVVIRDESAGDEKKVFIARSKRIKTITDSEVEAEVRKAAQVPKSFSLAVVYKGVTRPITGGEWIKMCMMNYHELVKKFKQDSINKINFEIEVYTHFKEVADRILNTRQSYETIRKELKLSERIVERIAGMKISTLRDLDPKAKLAKLEQEKKDYEALTTAKMLASYLK